MPSQIPLSFIGIMLPPTLFLAWPPKTAAAPYHAPYHALSRSGARPVTAAILILEWIALNHLTNGRICAKVSEISRPRRWYMSETLGFDDMVEKFHRVLARLPDYRIGQNKSYSIKEAVLSAFSVFYTQSPSFLAHQRTMKQTKGHSNAESLFGIESVPCDNQIRNLLDPIAPHYLFPMFAQIFNDLEAIEKLDSFRSFDDNLHIALDGVHYFSSKKIHCQNCSHRTTSNGVTTYFHSAITPVVVAPGNGACDSLRTRVHSASRWSR